MIDFKNAKYLKLRPVKPEKHLKQLEAMLLDDEKIACCFQTVRDYVVFTDRRMIAVNIQGVTGLKQSFTSLPYKRVQCFAVESAGVLDLDGELELWFSGLGLVQLEFTGGTDVSYICKLIAEHAL